LRRTLSARKARDQLEIRLGRRTLGRTLHGDVLKQYSDLVKTPGAPARKEGTPKGLSNSALQLHRRVRGPLLAHAAMEPLNVLVEPPRRDLRYLDRHQFQTGDRNAAARSPAEPETSRSTPPFWAAVSDVGEPLFGLCDPGGAGRQGRRETGEGDLDTGGRHQGRLLSPMWSTG